MAGLLDTILGRTNLGASDFNYDPTGKASSRYKQLSDPRFLLNTNLKIASNAAPSRANLLQIAAATGGSQGIANAQANAQGGKAQEQALNSYERSQQNFQGLANDALNMDLMNQKYIQDSLAQQEYTNAANTSGFISSGLTGLAGLAGGGAFNGATNWLSSMFSGGTSGQVNDTMETAQGGIDKYNLMMKNKNNPNFNGTYFSLPKPRGY